MKTRRAILTGIAIWIIAILFYSLSYFVPFLNDADSQANVVLFVVVIPLVWIGTAFYYKKERKTHGYWVGQVLLLTAVALDALITVPFFVIPKGGNHYTFFTSLGFWIIALEFLSISVLYYYANIHTKKNSIKQ